ncbi:hypothetical protein SAMN05660209_04170 [Geodermatophilus africanus]|uniref:Uncharacterized protein n=1 Tax=Geodermatophilus africanus TaxID=1137993 RepID=A0A1H3P205_9ACTN|nr:hypothetical protein SAMN05660209_04170 [Geodermatophilus africanus]
MAAGSGEVLPEVDDGVAVVRLNAPSWRNDLSAANQLPRWAPRAPGVQDVCGI